MPYAVNDDVRLYYESHGTGPPLVLHHGFSGSGQDWVDDGYVAVLGDHFQLLLLDARGHGRSDKPTEPESYAMERRVRDVVAVLDDEGLATAHYLGYSMGGRVGWALGKYAPERFASLIIGGASPRPHPEESERWIGWLQDGGIEGVIRGMDQLWGPLPDDFHKQMYANDAGALLAEKIASRDEPSLEDALTTMTMPCLLYVGSEDPLYPAVAEVAERLSQATLITLEGLDHAQAWIQSDRITPSIVDFLKQVARTAGTLGEGN